VFRCKHGATSGLEEQGCTKDQVMIAVQGSIQRPPHLHRYVCTYLHIYIHSIKIGEVLCCTSYPLQAHCCIDWYEEFMLVPFSGFLQLHIVET
jgi:hypothetical protein